MSSEQYIEQDPAGPSGGAELPTYDDLAAQNGPNSRFGRWRGWIEKRAAERYADLSPEERARRRERGWGNEEIDVLEGGSRVVPDVNASPPLLSGLHIQTHDLSSLPEPLEPQTPSPLPPLPFNSQKLSPSNLKLNQFGSRFLPHATSPIRCVLPLDSGRLLLIGHDEGLSVLDLFPKERSGNGGISIKGPNEARARPIWCGESVHQMSLLEIEDVGDGTAKGVVLVLIGSDPDVHTSKDTDPIRCLRMYNLAGLTSLARWTVSQEGSQPLDLKRPSNWQVQQSPSRRSRISMRARNIGSLIGDPPSHSQDPLSPPSGYLAPSVPSRTIRPPSLMRKSNKRSSIFSVLTPNRKDSDEVNWDVIDDLPLRWATDFVPFAATGSRLLNSSVLAYTLWSDENRKGKGGQLLAVATRNNIFLYETPKGERAFRFVKEFYTPLQPRSITFFQQYVQDGSKTSLDVGQAHRRTNSSATIRDSSRIPPPGPMRYGTHVSLFVVFDKKAGWIRLADSAVGEVELYDTGAGPGPQLVARQRSLEHLNTSSILRGRMSNEAGHPPRWLPIVRCKLPQSDIPSSDEVYLLSRGKQTHIVPCPLPVGSLPMHPLSVVMWKSTPTSVSVRLYETPANNDRPGREPFLQLIAFGEDGVEVEEISLSFLGKGKGKGQPTGEPVHALEDLGGDTGFLCHGGHWDQLDRLYGGQRDCSTSTMSAISSDSYDSTETDVILEKLSKEEGIYAWCRKGMRDWRVFWVGGSSDIELDGEHDLV